MAAGGWDLPFERNDEAAPFIDIDRASLAGAIVVMATVVDVPELGPQPGLVFRFTAPGGELYDPMLLLLDDDHMHNVVPLIGQAVTAAVDAAQKARS